ncbi:nose resistant to fluoxetine protein 6 [Rhipicephalus sanguineus]|uniref:nose resistant to fluoxetine protein 6 n=1 Tax=Rhipicephalus sanguineus TaxID=34632 RepID=UPI0020C33533|nr:nose resistant to fluoxetine protein 6 [Rhipicephalus sanguineus]
MCLYALEPLVDGPNTKAFFQNLHEEASSHWWHLVLQIRNFYRITGKDVLPHTWYLSADFQLFVISLLVLLIFKRLMLRTLDEYYIRPYYHAVCYFGGCMTCLTVDDFRESKISKRLQQVGWCVSVACMFFCVFVKFAWYTSLNPVPMGVALFAAFFDRILWTLFLAWITLACCSGRGGVLTKLLSWNAYVPLSKLSFGVYLIHVPFLQLWFHSSRERRYWSVFNQMTLLFALLVWSFLLSYLAFLVCEAPTAALDKLVFTALLGGRGNKQTTNNLVKTQPENNKIDGSDVKTQKNPEENAVSRC